MRNDIAEVPCVLIVDDEAPEAVFYVQLCEHERLVFALAVCECLDYASQDVSKFDHGGFGGVFACGIVDRLECLCFCGFDGKRQVQNAPKFSTLMWDHSHQGQF